MTVAVIMLFLFGVAVGYILALIFLWMTDDAELEEDDDIFREGEE